MREVSGYIGNFSASCGRGKSDVVPGPNHPGSVEINLANALLNEGKLLMTDN